MKRILFYLLVFSFFNSYSQKSNDFSTTIISQSEKSLTIETNIHDYTVKNLKADGLPVEAIQIKGASKILKKGAPSLPRFSESIIIPNNKDIEIEIINEEFIELSNINIIPSKGVLKRNINPKDIPFEYGEEYSQNKFYPEEKVYHSTPYIIRDYRGVTITINPVRYNPITKTARIYTKYVIKIKELTTSSMSNILTNNRNIKPASQFNRIYEKHFLNFKKQQSRYTVIDETPGNMLIICHDNYIDEMSEFVKWKKEKGIPTEIVGISEVGNNTTSIKNYVADYYNNNELVYLLLIGDNTHIAPNITGSGYTEAASDNYYGYILGNDHYLDIFVGRYSAESESDVLTQVERTIHYEKSVTASETWMQYALGSASAEGGEGQGDDGESDVEHMDNIKIDLEDYGMVVNHENESGGSNTGITNALNEGRGLINYVGHGLYDRWNNTDFAISNVNALENENKLPFIFDVACVNGEFVNQTCFAEAWLRATNNNNPTGAVAIIASTINQSWESPMCAQDEMNDILIESYTNNIKRTFGGITVNGIFQMIDEYAEDGENMADTWTIFGDPSLLVRTKVPTAINVSHAAAINAGQSSFAISSNAEGGLACITVNGEIIGREWIESGSANIDLSPSPTNPNDTVLLTVTAYNFTSYQTELNITTVEEAPIVGFTADMFEITVGESINFQDTSVYYPNTWHWYFENGTPNYSTEMNPEITYLTEGTHYVALYVENNYGQDSVYKAGYITVNPITNTPIIDFEASSNQIFVGESVNFTDLSTNLPSAWSWTFEGAIPETSTDQNPQGITYETAGTYAVKLAATNNIGSDSLERTAYIEVLPVVYCESNSSTCEEYIGNVVFNDIDNSSDCSGYADYTSISTTLSLNQDYPITITNPDHYNGDMMEAWIDWNQNGSFEDAGEAIGITYSDGTGTGTVTVPQGAADGNTILRIKIIYGGYGGSISPCGTEEYGETEDYTVNVDNTTGIIEIQEKVFSIYPNPAKETLFISNNKSDNISIYNTLGQKILNISDNVSQIDISGLTKGMYIVKDENSDFNIKFIKE